MKRFLSTLILLHLMFSLVGFQVGIAIAAPGDPVINPVANPGANPANPGTTPTGTTSAATTALSCADVLRLGKNTAKNPTPINEGDITVLLTEPIGSAPGGVSCGRIIECVRSDQRSKATTDDAKKTVDKAINVELANNYWQCIVSGKDGLALLNNYAGLVYRWIAGIVGSICVLIVIISGIQISMGGLSQEEVGSAKERIERSLIGLVVLFLSAFILYTINPVFFY